jgi:hypothetical protein
MIAYDYKTKGMIAIYMERELALAICKQGKDQTFYFKTHSTSNHLLKI